MVLQKSGSKVSSLTGLVNHYRGISRKEIFVLNICALQSAGLEFH